MHQLVLVKVRLVNSQLLVLFKNLFAALIVILLHSVMELVKVVLGKVPQDLMFQLCTVVSDEYFTIAGHSTLILADSIDDQVRVGGVKGGTSSRYLLTFRYIDEHLRCRL